MASLLSTMNLVEHPLKYHIFRRHHKCSKYKQSKKVSSNDKECTVSHTRHRKINCPVNQLEASVYFAEQTFLNQRLSKLASDTNCTSQRMSAVEKKYNVEKKKEEGDLTFVAFVSTNPLINPHKDAHGRRSGVSQRNRFDGLVLTEIMSELSEKYEEKHLDELVQYDQ